MQPVYTSITHRNTRVKKNNTARERKREGWKASNRRTHGNAAEGEDINATPEEMRDTNESTNERVLYFSVISMFVVVGMAIWQVLYLKKFFQSKKLL